MLFIVHLKLTDFGVSKTFTSVAAGSNLGYTLRYIAPERLLNPFAKFTHEELILSDNYGYGLIMWEVAMDGKLPYGDMDNTGMNVAKMAHDNPFHYIGEIPDDVPSAFRDIIGKFLSWEPSLRPSLTWAQETWITYINTAPPPLVLPFSFSESDCSAISSSTRNDSAYGTQNSRNDSAYGTQSSRNDSAYRTQNSQINPFQIELSDDQIASQVPDQQKEVMKSGLKFYRKKKYQKTIDYFQRSVLLNYSVTQWMVGICYRALENEAEALACFR